MVDQLQHLNLELQKCFRQISANKSESALDKLNMLLGDWPENADLIHLLALAHKALNNFDAAKNYFLQCLSINQAQPQVHNNLANLYRTGKQLDKAQEHYLAATRYQKNFIEAERNLGLCLIDLCQFEQAKDLFRRLTKINAADIISLVGLADCYRELHEYRKAQTLYLKAINIAPQKLSAWYKLGMNQQSQGLLQEAEQSYSRALRLDPNKEQVIIAFATLKQEQGDIDFAKKVFEESLARNPNSALLHKHFNEMLWQSKYANEVGNSYNAAINYSTNTNAVLGEDVYCDYVRILLDSGENDKANAILSLALALNPEPSSSLVNLQGLLLANTGDHKGASKKFEHSLSLNYSKDSAVSLVKTLLLSSCYYEAQHHVDRLLEDQPNCQLSWAFQGLVWRLTNNSKYDWLCDYNKMIGVYTLAAPAGYDNLTHYLSALKNKLLELHTNDHAPLRQSLRGGTQTAAKLLERDEREIHELKQQLQIIVKAYIDKMPNDDGHPLYRRKSSSNSFSGSWSVKLQPNGFHVNHVHPEGWISSSCYVSIPESMREPSGDSIHHHEGAIKFGESPLGLGDLEHVAREIVPQAGMVVLFPSYFWHGTTPFTGDESSFRLTSPFDVVPL